MSVLSRLPERVAMRIGVRTYFLFSQQVLFSPLWVAVCGPRALQFAHRVPCCLHFAAR